MTSRRAFLEFRWGREWDTRQGTECAFYRFTSGTVVVQSDVMRDVSLYLSSLLEYDGGRRVRGLSIARAVAG